MRIIIACTPGYTISACASTSLPRPFPWEWRLGHMCIPTRSLGHSCSLCSPAHTPHMQHAHTSLLTHLHGSACTCVYKAGGLWQGSQDPKGSPHPSTSSFLSLRWTPKSARLQAHSGRASPSLPGKCQFGKEENVCERHADLALMANSGPEPQFPHL